MASLSENNRRNEMSATKLMIAGAKYQTRRIATILATHATLEVRNVSPEDSRSNWVVTGTLKDVMSATAELVEANEAEQLYIQMAQTTGDFLNGVFE